MDQLLLVASGIALVVVACVVLYLVNSARTRRKARPGAHVGVRVPGQTRRTPSDATNHQANPETPSKSKRFPDLDRG